MSRGLAVRSGDISLHKVPCDRRPHCPASHAKNIHVIIFHALPGREVVVNQAGASAWNLVGAGGCTDAASANGDSALHLPRNDGLCQRDDKIRVVVTWTQHVSAKVDNLMSRLLKLGNQLFF